MTVLLIDLPLIIMTQYNRTYERKTSIVTAQNIYYQIIWPFVFLK